MNTKIRNLMPALCLAVTLGLVSIPQPAYAWIHTLHTIVHLLWPTPLGPKPGSEDCKIELC